MAPAGGDVTSAAGDFEGRCGACGADASGELFCPQCGAAVVPQSTKAQHFAARETERNRHKADIRMGLSCGFFVGGILALGLFVVFAPPPHYSTSSWGCFLSFFPIYGMVIGGGIGAAVSALARRQ